MAKLCSGHSVTWEYQIVIACVYNITLHLITSLRKMPLKYVCLLSLPSLHFALNESFEKHSLGPTPLGPTLLHFEYTLRKKNIGSLTCDLIC